ncbi:MAG: chorismate synthase [Myxococcales bacterium]|nr:chorismate synthase [Myxococcales bacterium]
MSSTMGRLFRVTTWGESHGKGLGCTIDGCPPGVRLDLERIQAQLTRRRPGQSKLVTPRQEPDRLEILSGVFEGRTTGTPIQVVIWNKDADSSKYERWKDTYRPSHADYTYDAKYGLRDWRGGGRASARETAARVAAGAIAEQLLEERYGVEIVGWVEQVAHLSAEVDRDAITRDLVDAHPTRCPDLAVAEAMAELIQETRVARDSLGGVVGCVARGVPAGWGEPVFDKAEALLAWAMMSLPASKGVEVGSGFSGALMRGSEHNDLFTTDDDGRIVTTTNYSGGIQGGITNGMPITMRVAFKPVATLARAQATVTASSDPAEILMKGRHDPCVLPRAVPLVETMAALVLIDLALLQEARRP